MELATEMLTVLAVGIGANIVGFIGAKLIFSLGERSDTETFEVRTKSGKLVSKLELHRNPSAEEIHAALDKVHEDERRLQHARS